VRSVIANNRPKIEVGKAEARSGKRRETRSGERREGHRVVNRERRILYKRRRNFRLVGTVLDDVWIEEDVEQLNICVDLRTIRADGHR